MKVVPLWGAIPSFPYDSFSQNLSELFSLPSVHIAHKKTEWLSHDQLLHGMGTHPVIQTLSLTPLTESLFFVMPKQGQQQLLELLLTKEQNPKRFYDESLQEGFFQFIFLSVLEQFNRSLPLGDLTAVLKPTYPLPESALAVDISIHAGHHQLWARLLISRALHSQLQHHFSQESTLNLTDPAVQSIPLSLHLEVGTTQLTSSQIGKIQTGDLVLLDRCGFDVAHQRGRAILTLGSTPLFDIRIKGHEAKIIEYAFYQEEKNPMRDEFPEDETPAEESPEEENPLWATESSEKGNNFIKEKDIPITITVEMGRIQMPLQKVAELKPGNVLDLSIPPSLGVNLTVGGKRIAKGELIQMGEVIGVKILKMSD